MSSNGKKVNSIQVDVIENRNDALDFIAVKKKLQGQSSFDNSDDNDYVQRKDITNIAPSPADGIITPGEISIDGAYLATFTSQFSYRLLGVVHDPTQPDIQLDAPDGTYARIDIIYGKTDGTYGKTTGVAAVTQETPLPPPNTILLAKIFRKVNGDNIISIVGVSGYVEQILAVIYGDTFHKYGSNIYMDAADGTKDPGDIVFRKWVMGVITEYARIYNETEESKKIMIKFDQDVAKRFEVTHSGNRIPIPVVDGTLVIAWQTDLVPNDPLGRTYAVRFYNIIQDIINIWDDSGTYRKNEPEWSYTKTGVQITTVTINNLFAGTISIL